MAIVVRKKKGETKEDLIRRFLEIFVKENIIEEVKKRVHYTKPSRRRYERQREIERRRQLEATRSEQ